MLGLLGKSPSASAAKPFTAPKASTAAGVTWARLHLGLGSAAVLFVVIKFINESSNLSYGFYIGIILAVALAAGGFLLFQEEQQGGGAGADAGPSM